MSRLNSLESNEHTSKSYLAEIARKKILNASDNNLENSDSFLTIQAIVYETLKSVGVSQQTVQLAKKYMDDMEKLLESDLKLSRILAKFKSRENYFYE